MYTHHTNLNFSNAGMGAIFASTMVTLESLVSNNTKINNKITPPTHLEFTRLFRD